MPERRLVQFLLEDAEAMLVHNEPILHRGKRVGMITSAMYGHTLGAAVGMGYVTQPGGVSDAFVAGGGFSVLIGNREVGSRASLRPLYDPSGARTRT